MTMNVNDNRITDKNVKAEFKNRLKEKSKQ